MDLAYRLYIVLCRVCGIKNVRFNHSIQFKTRRHSEASLDFLDVHFRRQ